MTDRHDARRLQPRPLERLRAAARTRWLSLAARRWRIILAVACFVAAGVLAALPPQHDGIAVLALARDLPAGAVLGVSDVIVIHNTSPPDGALPADADLAALALSGPARRGEILTDAATIGPSGPDPGPGRFAVPIPLPDGTPAELLRPGMHISVVVASESGTPQPLASNAIVLAAPAGAKAEVLVLAVLQQEADRLATGVLNSPYAIRFD